MSSDETDYPPPSDANDGKTPQPSYPPSIQDTPRASSDSEPLNARKDPESPAVKKFPIVVVTMLTLFTITLVTFLYAAKSAQVECVSTSISFKPSGPILAVMGATGTGKSSFIRDVQGRDSKGCLPKVGHGLQSCTKNVNTGQTFTILDTPGFDDIALSDSSILQALATELASIYQGGRHLAGLVYLHDISKVKMGRTSYKNLQLFQKLVGSQGLKNVILATTHWPSVEDKDLHGREQELKTTFWQPMTEHGSQISRHEGTANSARNIASKLVNKPPIVPKITDELVKKKLRFKDTEAGKLVNEDLKAYGADLKDEISFKNNQLEDLTRRSERDSLIAKNEREQLERQLRSAFQEVAKRDEARMELEDLNKRLSNERRDRLKDMQDLKKEKERFEKLLDDTTMRQKQMTQTLKTQNASYKFQPSFEFPRFGFQRYLGIFCWGAEMLFKIINALVVMGGDQTLEGNVIFWLVVQWIFWAIFSFLFFSDGPKTVSVFIAVCHVIYRLLCASHVIGYNTGVSVGYQAGESVGHRRGLLEERERNDAIAQRLLR
ncbi:hypothetical protein IQ07DRAFT_584237 [Pyrenochaeta sp. DS3sAY3a]|nr:hypothetical protein IQ07DRAFT_584237 [Pyrenochaeta sp. DS3sAY3a]